MINNENYGKPTRKHQLINECDKIEAIAAYKYSRLQPSNRQLVSGSLQVNIEQNSRLRNKYLKKTIQFWCK